MTSDPCSERISVPPVRINFGSKKIETLIALAKFQARYRSLIPSTVIYKVICDQDSVCKDQVRKAILSLGYQGFLTSYNVGQHNLLGLTYAGAHMALALLASILGEQEATAIEGTLLGFVTSEEYKALLNGTAPLSSFIEKHRPPECDE